MRNCLLAAPDAILSFLTCLPVAAQPPAHPLQQPDRANAGPCTNPKLTRYPVSANSSGDTVEGGVCVEISPVNRLRNFVYISTTITQSAGPSPSSVFSPSEQQPPASGEVRDMSDLEGRVAALETRLQTHERD